MISYYKILLLFIGGITFFGGNYQRHKQVCSGAFAIDRTWKLAINRDSSFNYCIKTINTKAIKRQSEEVFFGKWELLRNDTLKLSDTRKGVNPIYFLMRENRFIPIEHHRDTISGMVVFLDYLEKTK